LFGTDIAAEWATLLIEDVLSIANAIIQEYDRTNVIQLLEQTSTVLAYRGTPNEHAYAPNSQPLRIKAQAIIDGESIALKSRRVKEFTEQGMLAGLLPRDIAGVILTLLKPSLSLAGVSSEANDFQNRVAIARASLLNIIDVSTKIGIQPFVFTSDKAVLLIVVPRELFGTDAGQLGTIVKNVNEFISEVTELGGKLEVPEFRYSGTSDFSLWQLITFENAVKVLQVVKICFEAAKSYIEMRRSISELRKNGIEKDSIEKYEQRQNEGIVSSLDKEIAELFRLSSNVGPGRQIELRSIVTNKSNYIANKMERGLIITVEKRE
jgi:hypothetical protein